MKAYRQMWLIATYNLISYSNFWDYCYRADQSIKLSTLIP